jgi:hypothetical protein
LVNSAKEFLSNEKNVKKIITTFKVLAVSIGALGISKLLSQFKLLGIETIKQIALIDRQATANYRLSQANASVAISSTSVSDIAGNLQKSATASYSATALGTTGILKMAGSFTKLLLKASVWITVAVVAVQTISMLYKGFKSLNS